MTVTSAKTNLVKTVQGEVGGPIPAGFWLHFPPEYWQGDQAVAAQAEFLNETDASIVKVMNENLYPTEGEFTEAIKWAEVKSYDASDPRFADQVEIVRKVAEKYGDTHVVLATIHGVVASLHHVRCGGSFWEERRHYLPEHLREEPELFKSAVRTVTDSLIALTQACLDAGADGIYYAALGGERELFTTQEFNEVIAPADRAVLESATNRGAFNILHICKEDIELERYKDYPAEVINWATHVNEVSLEAGRAIFPDQVLLGGIDNFGDLLTSDNPERIKKEVRDILDSLSSQDRFILGADCTLATQTPYANIRSAVQAARDYR